MSTTNSSPKRINSKIKCNLSFLNVLEKRALGLKTYQIEYDDLVALKLYNNFYQYEINKMAQDVPFHYGGIFNLEFSLDGKLLVAACEGKQVLLFDAANQRLLNSIDNAHQNCVNCVRFLNEKHFATCSDDTSIKIWDIRKIKSSIKTLHGHTSWVKNIEWSEKDNVMVTSAFDGSIYAWNLKGQTENNMQFEKVFVLNGLMRMKLTEDGSKMVISSANGYMIIIHDLDLMTLATDLRTFRPDLYRLMQRSEQCFPIGTIHNYLFSPHRKRNRIEFIDDFPNEAEVISSLQIHPHGWCAASRSINREENEEWTSIHDIQTRDPNDYANSFMYIEEDEPEDEVLPEGFNNPRPTDLWMGYTLWGEFNNHNRVTSQETQNTWGNFQLPAVGILNSGLIGLNTSYSAYFEQHPEEQHKVIKNLPRLTHFVKEKNVGKGYIKELCFSSDGRILCSPYEKGIRLLGFNERCQELSMCIPDNPQQLKIIIEMDDYHKDIVVSCKFSPTHYQLVSGCLGSEIKWYQPVV